MTIHLYKNIFIWRYIIYSNGLPDHATQQVNPNTATAQNIELTIKQSPTVDTTNINCIPMAMIGLTKHGVAVYNLLTSSYKNAVEGSDAETFDSCDGHPTNTGSYHYHKLPSSCVYSGNTDEFIGVAIDGIPIYGPKVSWKTGLVTSADLDICNGKTMDNGEYRYFVTSDWPYFMGCLSGEIVDTEFQTNLNRVTCSTTTSGKYVSYSWLQC